MEWTTLASKTIIKDRWIDLRADTCRMPDGTLVDPFYVLSYPDFLNAVALTNEGQVVLTREYRHGIGQVLLELPSGRVDARDVSIEAAMRRELLEETGYAFEEVIHTASLSPNPANTDNLVHCFLALGGKKVAEPQLDATEDIAVELVSMETFREMVYTNQLLQAVHVASALYAFRELLK